MTILNWSTENTLARMRQRGWIERSRQTIPAEGRVVVSLPHPRQSAGRGAERRVGPLNRRQLSLFASR